MGTLHEQIDQKLADFIRRQKLFFVATTPTDGRINLSPKGMDSLRVAEPKRILWLNLTGSGNETAAHLLEDDRMTLMWCAFEGEPMILRAYGHARAIHREDPDWPGFHGLFPDLPGARQIIDLQVDSLQSSCGFGIPQYDFVGNRDKLVRWAEKKGDAGIKRYQQERNHSSIDGKPTHPQETETQ